MPGPALLTGDIWFCYDMVRDAIVDDPVDDPR